MQTSNVVVVVVVCAYKLNVCIGSRPVVYEERGASIILAREYNVCSRMRQPQLFQEGSIKKVEMELYVYTIVA